ncbi:rhodanese-related sulfurtransferase [Myxosarcina sp. GI1]|uniref:oxygen-dependent tRNA uridine(34) hydroxylase TrhO n=1 Tax=Myxosarcina sp. GI1 TaxID=1541065 RepID=UPI00055E974D|nr:rhodanese-related sulfurtransferase [Myxosarcina sp. GI1]
MSYTVVTFYKFITITELETKQELILAYCLAQDIKGTIILAEEGINGTIAGTQDAIDAVITYLHSFAGLADLEAKQSTADNLPFARMKVKIKPEIVTFGIPEAKPDCQVGKYVEPQDWNQIISDPDVTVIDTRNEYETKIGSFQGAIDPKTNSFREFSQYAAKLDPQEHSKVAMFCTGGIRCEKASSYLLSKGFKEVYHLKGGILKYLKEVPPVESLWQGECFVFDERVAVKQGLETGSYDLCYACGHPISAADKASTHYELNISCPYCYDKLTREKKLRQENRKRQREQKKSL